METKDKNGSGTITTEAVAMPHNNDIERAVLGAMLIDNISIGRVADMLKPSDFYNTQNRRMFQTLVGMWKLGEAVDQLTVVEALLEAGKLDEAGGPAYVAELASEMATSANVEFHAQILLRNAAHRGLIVLGQQMIAGREIDSETINDYQERLDELSETSRGYSREYAPIVEEPLSEWDDVEPREWLIEQLLPANELTLFTGRGGVGKSRLMLQIVGKLVCGWGGTPFQHKVLQPDFSNNQEQRRVYIASWEDDRDEHKRRLHQAQGRLGWMEEDVFAEQVKFVDMRKDGRGPLWGVPPGENSYARASLLPVGEVLLKQVEAFEPDVLVLDPLSAAFGGNENDRAGVREFTTYLSGWANRHKCAIVILGHPPKSDATYSGNTDWEGSPRAMWFLEKDDQKDDQGRPARYRFDVTKLSYAAKPERPRHLELDKGVWIEQTTQTGGVSDGEAELDTAGL